MLKSKEHLQLAVTAALAEQGLPLQRARDIAAEFTDHERADAFSALTLGELTRLAELGYDGSRLAPIAETIATPAGLAVLRTAAARLRSVAYAAARERAACSPVLAFYREDASC